jgi:two-component system chemotaxis sensor kinase CheA
MTSSDLAEFKPLFIKSAHEYIQILENQLAVLKDNPADTNAIKESLRVVHTFNGQGAVLGLKKLRALASVLEEIFREVQNNEFILSSEILAILDSAYKLISAYINNIEKTKDSEELETAQMVQQLTKLIKFKS